MSELSQSQKINSIRLRWGVLNDSKLDRLRKLGVLCDSKKNLTTSLRMASVKVALLKVLRKISGMISPTIKLFQAYLFGLPQKPLILFSHYLTKFPQLETFILQLIVLADNEFSKRGIAIIGHSLRKLRKLKRLNIELEGRYHISSGVLSSFARDLNHLQNIMELRFGLKGFSFEGIGITKVFTSLKRLHKLESLHINLSTTYCPGDKGLKGLASSLKKLQRICSFSLDIENSPNLEANSMQQFLENLSFLTNLEFLELNFIRCGVTPLALTNLSQSLTKLEALKTFKLFLFDNELISSKEYRELWDSFKRLRKLEELEIRSGSINNLFAIENEGLRKLGQIGTLENLKKVHFTLRGSEEINDKGLLEFGKGLSQTKSLKAIEIEFMKCDCISEEGISSLQNKLREIPDISFLKVRN